MRTISKEIQLYTYAELSDDAKDRVQQWLNSDGHHWGDEYFDSLRAFSAQFGAKVTDWSYGPWDVAEISTDATTANFRGFTLRQARTLPEYPTGYCMDYTLRETFIKEFERTGDAFAAFNDAMDAGIKEARADWEYQYDDGAMAETCEANGYEFTADGRIA